MLPNIDGGIYNLWVTQPAFIFEEVCAFINCRTSFYKIVIPDDLSGERYFLFAKFTFDSAVGHVSW
jgi:hypothetical protein